MGVEKKEVPQEELLELASAAERMADFVFKNNREINFFLSSQFYTNIGLKQPEGLEWNEVTSRVFSERKNLGKSSQDFLFNVC